MRRLTRRQRVAAIVLAVLALSFLTLDLGGSGLQSAHGGVRGTLGALYRGTDGVLGPVRRFVQGIPGAGSNKAHIDELEAANRRLRQQLADAETDRATRSELARLQLAATTGRHHILPARVTALGPAQGFDWTATLDVGTEDGAHVGQTVTDGRGLVGRVLHADRSSCVVLLAADPGSGVGVRNVRSGQLGVATGAGADGFLLTPLDPSSTVRVGDQLVTGPVGSSSFAIGVAVGTVRSVRVSADGSTTAALTPTASPTGIDLVGVIVDGAVARTDAGGRGALSPGR